MTHIEKIPRPFLRQPPPEPVRLREDELDTLVIFRVIRRNILLILLTFAVLTIAALPSILALKRSYYAEARLLIRAPLTASLSASRPEGYGQLNLATEAARLGTRANAVALIDAFDLRDLEEFNPRLRTESWVGGMLSDARSWLRGLTRDSAGNETPGPGIDEIDLVIPEFLSALRIGQLADVVSIGFSSGDPELAAAVPNKLVTTYLEARDRQMRDDMRGAERWLDQRITEQQRRLAAAQDLVKSFRDANGLVSGDARADVAKSISALLARRTLITARRADLTAQIATLEDTDKTDLSGPGDGDVLAKLRRDLRAKRRELTQLQSADRPDRGGVVDALARIRELEAAIGGETDRQVRIMRGELQALDQEEAALLAGLDAERLDYSRTNALETHLEELVRAAATEQSALDALSLQGRALESQGQVPAAEVEILSPATVPLAPTGRARMLYLTAAMIGATAVALTLALTREVLDRGIRGLPQLEGVAGIKPAGLIPILGRRRPRRAIARLRSDGMFTEALRGVMLTLDRVDAGAGGVVVTSALPGEGKSTVSAGLALQYRAAGRRALLVDADPRHGALHQIFGLPSEPGFSDYLRGECTLEDAVQRHRETGIEFIAKGSARCAPLRDSQRAARLFEHCRGNNQMLILDTAPILATIETAMLAGLAEQSLLVARWGSTRISDIELAVSRLRASNPSPVVVALNMVDPDRYALYGFKDSGVFSRSLRKYYRS